MELEGSFPFSQDHATCPSPEPLQSIPHPFRNISWSSVLVSSSHPHLGLPSGLLPSVFPPTKTLHAPLLSPIHVTCPFISIFLHFLTRIIFGEQYRLWYSSFCLSLQSHFLLHFFNLSFIAIRVMIDSPLCCGRTVFGCVARVRVILTEFLVIFFNPADSSPE